VEGLGKPRQLNSSKIKEILLRNPLNSKLERETGLEPATTCLEDSDKFADSLRDIGRWLAILSVVILGAYLISWAFTVDP
jgi:hypothetical protein